MIESLSAPIEIFPFPFVEAPASLKSPSGLTLSFVMKSAYPPSLLTVIPVPEEKTETPDILTPTTLWGITVTVSPWPPKSEEESEDA